MHNHLTQKDNEDLGGEFFRPFLRKGRSLPNLPIENRWSEAFM
jgi:hypothetical protein